MLRHLYVHIPFCHRICPYCSFHKHTPGNTRFRDFVDALVAEAGAAARTRDLVPETIYFGGGTPTLLSVPHLERLLAGLHDALDLSAVREWTVEANPRTFDEAKASLLRAGGVDRISLGVQSFDAGVLHTLGRDHSPDEAEEGFHLLRAAGIPSINVDLMFAIPGQSADSWEATLERTLALGPDHVSAYNLTYEEDTPFLERLGRGEFPAPDDGRDAAFFETGRRRLEAAGLPPYEISNHARPGHESRHNRAYWEGADYLGIGPGAVSTVERKRWTSIPDTARWIAAVLSGAPEIVDEESLDEAAFRLERLALLLRTRDGLPLAFLSPPQRDRSDDLAADGLVETVPTTAPDAEPRLRLTRHGRLLADSVAAHLALVE